MATKTSPSPMLSPKDPNEVKDYGVNFADVLPDGVTLADADVVNIAPTTAPALEAAAAISAIVNTLADVRTTGGVVGTTYRVTVRGTFSDGQTRDRTIIFRVRSL